MLTHRNMLTAATSISTYLRMSEDDVILGVLPLAFDYGLYQMIMSTPRRAPGWCSSGRSRSRPRC